MLGHAHARMHAHTYIHVFARVQITPVIEYVLPDERSMHHMVQSAITIPLMPVDTNTAWTRRGASWRS